MGEVRVNEVVVTTFNDRDTASDYFLAAMDSADRYKEYFKGEIVRLSDGRWRVGILTEDQLELAL